jgi:hypothetical protein
MHPAILYDFARAKMDDEQRAADRRRLARIAAESRPARTGDQSIVTRVWNLLVGTDSTVKPTPAGTAA